MNLHTYTESKGHSPFNWLTALTASVITWSDLQHRAGDWVTCACGNQCSIISRSSNGRPMDPLLAQLGGAEGFYGAISSRDAKLALHYLDLIETHSSHLIADALPEAIRRIKEKKTGLKVRQAREVKELKARHDQEARNLKARHDQEARNLKNEIDIFNKNFPGSV